MGETGRTVIQTTRKNERFCGAMQHHNKAWPLPSLLLLHKSPDQPTDQPTNRKRRREAMSRCYLTPSWQALRWNNDRHYEQSSRAVRWANDRKRRRGVAYSLRDDDGEPVHTPSDTGTCDFSSEQLDGSTGPDDGGARATNKDHQLHEREHAQDGRSLGFYLRNEGSLMFP